MTTLRRFPVPMNAQSRVFGARPITGCIQRTQIPLCATTPEFASSQKTFGGFWLIFLATPCRPIDRVGMTCLCSQSQIFSHLIVYTLRRR